MKKMKKKTWLVRIEYTVRGTVRVEAATEAEAQEAAHDGEMRCPPTCEIVDWETSARVEEDDA